MKLVLTEEEQFLQDTAKNFAAERCPISHFRNLRDTNDPILWDKDIWSEMGQRRKKINYIIESIC